MAKKPLVIANWKMRLSLEESIKLALLYKKLRLSTCDLVICPSVAHLKSVSEAMPRNAVLGAQNCFWESAGAFTGETSPTQLKELGCKYILVGHSERRTYQGETDEMVHQKTTAILASNMIPVVCVGETFEERQQGNQDYTLIRQVTSALEGVSVSNGQQVIVAYEPVWVIGTGQAIEPVQAELAHQIIWQTLYDIFGDSAQNSFRVIYGGSVDDANVREFVSLNETSGILVGANSLRPDKFANLISKL